MGKKGKGTTARIVRLTKALYPHLRGEALADAIRSALTANGRSVPPQFRRSARNLARRARKAHRGPILEETSTGEANARPSDPANSKTADSEG